MTRAPINSAAVIRFRNDRLALDTTRSQELSRTVLAALAATRPGEELVVQVVLQRGHTPAVAPEPSVEWWRHLTSMEPAKPVPLNEQLRSSAKSKASQYGFVACLRVGVVAKTSARRRSLILGLVSALGSAQSPGVRVELSRCQPEAIEAGSSPRLLGLTRLSSSEIGPLLGLPFGESDLPGLPKLHPKPLPAKEVVTTNRVFAVSNAPASLGRPIGLSTSDGVTHLSINAPTGAGKSTVLHRLAVADMQSGGGLAVLDPKADLVEAILSNVPANRRKDVCILDPTDAACPVGFNPLRVRPGESAEVVADAVTAALAGLWADTGVRTMDVLSAAISTLVNVPGSTMLDLPKLLTDQRFRSHLVGQIQDETLAGFWAGLEAESAAQQAQIIAPVMTRLRQFLSRKSLRNILGQPEPRFDLAEVFAAKNPKNLLVPLNQALLGAGTAALFGSLVVAQLWNEIQARAAVPVGFRRPATVIIDEAPSLINLPLSLSDALAQARGYGVGFVLAAQFRSQWPTHLRDAIDANCRSKICFTQPSSDAKAMAAISGGQVETADFMALGQYEIYASLAHNGFTGSWLSAKTLPPLEPTGKPEIVREASRLNFGRTPVQAEPVSRQAPENLGRRRRS